MQVKTRIVSALVGIVLLLLVLFNPHLWVFAVVAALLSGIATWELLHNTTLMKSAVVCAVSAVLSALLVVATSAAQNLAATARPWYPMPTDAFSPLVWLLLIVYAVFMLIAWLVCRKRIGFLTFGASFLLTLYATLGFSALSAMRIEAGEELWYLLVLIIPWMSDTGAYFTGCAIGKHKMAPVISPKKTWEGFFGGWAVSVASAAVFAVICNAIGVVQGVTYKPENYALIAAVLAPLSVLGDLLASWLKRRYGIKDYGKLMPGHGGVMDRFDSVVFIAPLMYVIYSIFG